MKRRKRVAALAMTAVMAAVLLAGCGTNGGTQTTASASDKEAAGHVADLIDAIYVQERTDETDAQCRVAKDAWDALTDAQKALVSGENALPEYFGLDTGDASKDDPLNADGIGENEILAVSFGTSYNDSRVSDIGGIEKALAAAYPDWSVRRAFTAQIIINHVEARDGEYIDNMTQALDRAVKSGVKNLVVQPTHLMHGAEYDEMCDALDAYSNKFETVSLAEPLLGEVGEDGTVVNADKEAVAKAVTAQAVADAGYESLDAAAQDGTAFVFMGHGTSHTANVTYDQMQSQMEDLGYENVFIGTVEGKPADTACEAVIEKVKSAGYKKVVLRPLMVVAGDHANNDMAGGDEDSWKSQFTASGAFDKVTCQIAGLGRIKEIQDLYITHTADAIASLANASGSSAASASGTLSDGTYTAEFDTDSSMFHVNEAYDGRGTLTVKDGVMTIHISLPSESIVNLFVGTAEDAQKDGAALLYPTTDAVQYADGSTEEVYGYDVPVPALDQEFDLAILGTKGTWYDHKVSVSDPQPVSEADSSSAHSEASGTEASGTMANVTLEGGSGKASVQSPCAVTEENGQITQAVIVWNSSNYDYMIVDGVKYTNENEGGNSTFTIPVSGYGAPMDVVADTTAMSKPHEIEYTLTFTKE
jgi:cobalamin biosynthesis Co2+ chelatase CbiK